jgi:hypothetical protein
MRFHKKMYFDKNIEFSWMEISTFNGDRLSRGVNLFHSLPASVRSSSAFSSSAPRSSVAVWCSFVFGRFGKGYRPMDGRSGITFPGSLTTGWFMPVPDSYLVIPRWLAGWNTLYITVFCLFLPKDCHENDGSDHIISNKITIPDSLDDSKLLWMV